MARRFSISEMFGRNKKPDSLFGKITASLWGGNVTVDYARSDYTLFRAIYHAAIMTEGRKSVGEDFVLGAGFAKPIINSTTGFALGQGFTVAIDGAEKGSPSQVAQDDINQWIKEHIDDFYNLLRYGLREGDSFAILHDDYSIEFCEPSTVEVVYDPTNGGVVGYDVTETVKNPDDENSKITYRRYYRHDSYKVTQQIDNGAETIVIERVFTVDGIVDLNMMTEEERSGFGGFEPEEIIRVPLPIVHYANEIEPKNIYGVSDLQNTLVYFKGYSKVLQEATKSNIYNATPIPVISGDKNDQLLEGDGSKKNIAWGRNMVLYLKGDNADAKFMTVPDIMGDTGKLLEYYFYLIVQASETPEFILGTAIQGSKASAQEQMPIMVKKAERKRAQLKSVLRAMIESYIYKKFVAGDQAFYEVHSQQLDFNISFPPIVDVDKKLTLETINALVEQGILSDTTALELASIEQVSDVDIEIEQARKDAALRQARLGMSPDTVNVDDELDELDDDGNPINNDEE